MKYCQKVKFNWVLKPQANITTSGTFNSLKELWVLLIQPKEKWVEQLQKMVVFSSDNLLLNELKGITCLLKFLKQKWYKAGKILALLKQKERKKSKIVVRL